MRNPFSDPWHYPRQELAQKYLAIFDIGLESARGIFAKRRMGKTEFLNKDLIPAAENAGYLTAYANLWENRDNPEQALLSAVLLALAPQGVDKFLQRFNTPIKKMALCEIEWVIKFQFATKEINHVDEVSRIAVAPRPSFG